VIEDALRRIHEAGYRVSNLFELSSGKWQANVRDPVEKSFGFGVSDDPEKALHMAMAQTLGREVQWYGLMRALGRLNTALERLTAHFEERNRAG
jgi:hypothetical protein